MKKEDKRLEKLFWIDMEMTGLFPERDRILETAVIITNLDFTPLDQFETAVYQSPECLEGMDDWCKRTHSASGLIERIPSGISESQLDQALYRLADQHFGQERVVLCGNSIGQDRKFIDRYLPAFASKLHYRMIDVSSFKEIYKNKFGVVFTKQDKHRALEDIQESILELKHYTSMIHPEAPYA